MRLLESIIVCAIASAVVALPLPDDGDNSEAGLGSWVEGGSALLGGGATAWWLNRNTPEKQNGCVDEMIGLWSQTHFGKKPPQDQVDFWKELCKNQKRAKLYKATVKKNAKPGAMWHFKGVNPTASVKNTGLAPVIAGTGLGLGTIPFISKLPAMAEGIGAAASTLGRSTMGPAVASPL